MPFTVSWTAHSGSKKLELETAGDALREYMTRGLSAAVKVVIKDDRGQKLRPDDLVALVAAAKDSWAPRGPRGERRSADVIGNAVKVMRIAPAMLLVWRIAFGTLSDVVAAMDAVAPKPGPRGPYKKRG